MHNALTVRGAKALKGSVRVDGAKNAVLPIMAACLLSEEASVIEGVPRVTDVANMAEILKSLNVAVETQGDGIRIHPGSGIGTATPYEMVNKMRASICLLGPLLAKKGQAQVSMPGGCVIGSRPIDLHLKGLEGLGASFSVEHGDIIGTVKRLKGAEVHLLGTHGTSVLATANVMMAATLAEGVTTIESAACEPEVVDLANFLNAIGARIEGQGTSRIRIEGVEKLGGARYRIIPDRILTGTLIMAASATGGDVFLEGAVGAHLTTVLDKLREAGVEIQEQLDGLRVKAKKPLNAVDFTTLPYPGFPTDLQAPMMALMCSARGVSMIVEKVYPDRFMHVSELCRMGADIKREGSSAVVKGVERLSGAPVRGSDLRATAALVIAGLSADNETVITGLEHLDRGYQHLEEQLCALGAVIERTPYERRESA